MDRRKAAFSEAALGEAICAFAPSLPLGVSRYTAPRALSHTSRTRHERTKRARARPLRFPPLAPIVMSSSRAGAQAETPASGLENLLENPDKRRYCFVTAKGGCGKTTTSAALALKMADESIPTLIISIDPAHSLGDALRVDLSDGKLHKLEPNLPLYALECDTTEAVREFQTLISGLRGATGDGGGDDGQAGWADVASMLDTIPPGADEFIALISFLKLVENQSEGIDFKRIVVDCAPTGHTLRLLSFPDFLDSFLTKALALRKKLGAASNVVGTVSKMFAKGRNVNVNEVLDKAAVQVEEYRDRMNELSDMLRNPGRTEFVVVTIPTVMAVQETKRLLGALEEDGIWVRHAVANMIIPSEDGATQQSYLKRLRMGQARELAFATEELADEFDLDITPVFRFDTEVTGVYALRALAMSAFTENRVKSYGPLFSSEASGGDAISAQFVFTSGKGGVGKTSISCTMGVALADRGLKTLVISTDPAHSLGDSLGMSFDGGEPVLVEGTNNNLYCMEIDTAKAVAEFKAIVKDFSSAESTGVGTDIARNLGLGEFADLLDNAPPGIDELVALTRVVELVNDGKFDRIVCDTAPTGHTLRLLRFPEFLDGFLGKLLRLKQRLDKAMNSLRSVLGGQSTADAVDAASARLEGFRKSMKMVRELIADGSRTQFVVVTVPTGLAMAESERLIKALKADGVRTKALIVNQVIADDSASGFVERIVRGQDECMTQLRTTCDAEDIHVTEVPFLDTEVRDLPALRALGMLAFRGSATTAVSP